MGFFPVPDGNPETVSRLDNGNANSDLAKGNEVQGERVIAKRINGH